MTDTPDFAATTLRIADIFAFGIGPSSSHTTGPMRAARHFAADMAALPATVVGVECDLYGSLALTGLGHGTDKAVILGLSGEAPEDVDPEEAMRLVAAVRSRGCLSLSGGETVPFGEDADLRFHPRTFLPRHPNGMELTVRWADGTSQSRRYYSIGGGAIVWDGAEAVRTHGVDAPHPFGSAARLLEIGDAHGLGIGEILLRNEDAHQPRRETERQLDAIRDAMMACIDRGLRATGMLPGRLNVARRARGLHETLLDRTVERDDPTAIFTWPSLWAIAVNEENAAGGRVVTAPTNGAAGVIPAVLKYYERFVPGASREGARLFLCTAAAIGMLYKLRASVSAAEMGCQGEIGVACSMAAGGLAAVMGGSNRQIENAAEIGMEHNLGLTCDPVGGLVQIPCIERNSMGAVQAINAALLALDGDGRHVVSLDAVIETMRQTGHDMRRQYKETSLGGLAVNVVEC